MRWPGESGAGAEGGGVDGKCGGDGGAGVNSRAGIVDAIGGVCSGGREAWEDLFFWGKREALAAFGALNFGSFRFKYSRIANLMISHFDSPQCERIS